MRPDLVESGTWQIAKTIYNSLLLSRFDHLFRRRANANVVAFVLDYGRSDSLSAYYHRSCTKTTSHSVGVMGQSFMVNDRIEAKEPRRNNWDLWTWGLRVVEQAFPNGISKESQYGRPVPFGH